MYEANPEKQLREWGLLYLQVYHYEDKSIRISFGNKGIWFTRPTWTELAKTPEIVKAESISDL